MKLMKYAFFLIIMTLIVVSCKDKAPNFQKMELEITGMTCEIGCARLIESKLSKTNGVKFAKVSFKDSLGFVEYDTSILSQFEVNNIVEKIADGNLYKVSKNKNVNIFTIIKK